MFCHFIHFSSLNDITVVNQNHLYKLELCFVLKYICLCGYTNRFWPVMSVEAITCDPTTIFSAVPSYYIVKTICICSLLFLL